jgi:3-oxoacyl-[acyl-carrier-protein] synthase III
MTWLTAVQTTHLEKIPTIEHRVSTAKSIISKANIDPSKICAVLSTGIDVYIQPSDSIAIASAIDAEYALCASINNSCASVSAAIDIATHQINGRPDKVAVVTSSSIFNEIHQDNSLVTCANGVGAALISNSEYGLKILNIKHKCDAQFWGLKTIEPATGEPASLRFNEVKSSPAWDKYRQAAVDFPVSVMKEALDEIGWTTAEIDHWILHRSELTNKWCFSLGIKTGECRPNMGSMTTLDNIYELQKLKLIAAKNKVAVLEIGLGMSVSVILLQNGDDLWIG